LFKDASCSLMEAARFSWLIVRSYMFMSEVNNRVSWRKQDLARCVGATPDRDDSSNRGRRARKGVDALARSPDAIVPGVGKENMRGKCDRWKMVPITSWNVAR
jgi:hypothetical protein